MRRTLMPALIALAASSVFVHAAAPAQPLRKLEFSRIGAWEVAAIGNDEKVNHCALTRGTSSAELKPGEPKFLMIVDATWMILRVRAAEYKFTEKKALAVTAITAEGTESQPMAATAGPDLVDIRFSAERKDMDPLLATKHLDVRTEEGTVRLSFAGLGAARGDFDQCLANIGKPAKGWSAQEIDRLASQAKRGKAKCTARDNVTLCDVE